MQPCLRLSAFKGKTETQVMCTEMSALSKALSMCPPFQCPFGMGAMTSPHFPQITMFSFLTATAKQGLYKKISQYDDSE